MLPATLLVGSLMYWPLGHQDFGRFLWVFGVLSFFTGLTGSLVAWPFYYAWMGFVFVVGTCIGIAALTLVYYGVVTPMGLLARAFGRDRLRRKPPQKPGSLWSPVRTGGARTSLEKQF